MSAKYHLNPETGDVKVCRAFVRSCRFGDEQHSSSKTELQEKFEKLNSKVSLPRLKKTRPKAAPESVYSPVNKDGEAVRVFDNEDPANKRLTAFYCKKCSAHLSDEDADTIISWDRVKCSCGTKLSRQDSDLKNNLGLAVLKKDLWLTDSNNRDGGIMYHATYDENWHQFIRENPDRLVHIGSEDAAFSRASELETLGGGRNLVIYEIELANTSSSGSVLHEDLADAWDEELSPSNEHIKDSFHLYVNGWEEHGSVSSILTEKHIRIKGRKRLKVDGLGRATTSPDPKFVGNLVKGVAA